MEDQATAKEPGEDVMTAPMKAEAAEACSGSSGSGSRGNGDRGSNGGSGMGH